MRAWIVGCVGALGGLAAGFLLAAEADSLRERYGSLRSQARAAIGPDHDRAPPPRIKLNQASVRIMTTPARPCPSPDDALVIVAGGQSNAGNNIPTRYTAGDANPRIALRMNTDILGKEYRWDECHFNARGREAIVETSLPQIIAQLQPRA